ncbi:16S rRNA (guanine(527)-N(7))-methyltransferase RsmG [Nocardioides montaniterrae]
MKQDNDAAVGVPDRHPAAARHFPAERLPLIDRYAELLCTEGVVRGLIGPREAPRIWDRHILNSVLMSPELPADCTLADIGTGAGLPGLVLAIARPDVSVTLVEPLLRRTTFLEEVAAELELVNVRVVRGRADALHGKERFDVVTARAVSALDNLLEWCLPLTEPAGALSLLKGESATAEIESATALLERWGCAEPIVNVYADEDDSVVPARVVRVTAADPARVSWPPVGRRKSARDGRRRATGQRTHQRGKSRRKS